nr:hypothetical protein [Tanacetum cinerariifolium]
MPRAIVGDIPLIKSYIPKVSETLERLIHENVFNLGGHSKSPPSLRYVLDTSLSICHGTLPHLDNNIYNVIDQVMPSLALRQNRRPRSDRGTQKARHSVSFLSTHHFGSSSHQEDEDNNEETSQSSTLSPNSYLNSLSPLAHQTYRIPTSSEQTDCLLFERQTTLFNQTQQIYEEVRGGFKSFGKALKGVFGKKKK